MKLRLVQRGCPDAGEPIQRAGSGEGQPGSMKSFRSKSGGDHSAGSRPARIESACLAVLSCWRSEGRGVRSLASWVSAVNTSVRAAFPASNFRRTSDRFCSSLGNDVFGRLNLRAQGCDGDGLGHGVAGKGQVGGGQFVALKFGQRLLLFHLAPDTAEHIRRITDSGTERIEIGDLCAAGGLRCESASAEISTWGKKPPFAAATVSRAAAKVARAAAMVRFLSIALRSTSLSAGTRKRSHHCDEISCRCGCADAARLFPVRSPKGFGLRCNFEPPAGTDARSPDRRRSRIAQRPSNRYIK